MNVSTRGIVALGVGLFGVGCVVGPLLAQQKPAPGQDADVRKSANTTTAPAAAAKPAVLAIGSVDIDNVIKNYDKLKVQKDEYEAYAMKKQQEVMKIGAEMKDEVAKLQKMTPNSVDAKKIEDHLTSLKAQGEAFKESAQRDLAMRETEIMAQTFKEIFAMVTALAQHKGLTYVVKTSSREVSATNPDSLYAEMNRSVLYADPRNDITEAVIVNLNARYKAAGGIAPRQQPAATKGAAPAANPPAAPTPRSGTGNN